MKCVERTRFIFSHAKRSGVDCTPDTVEKAKTMLGEVMHKTVSITAPP